MELHSATAMLPAANLHAVCLIAWPLNESEPGVDLVLI